MVGALPDNAARVFLSYHTKDVRRVERVRRLLKLAGFGPWMDSERLWTAGARQTDLLEAIRASDFVVAFLSDSTSGSRQETELRIAMENTPEGRRPEIPFILPGVIEDRRKGEAEGVIPEFLRTLHVIDFANEEAGWQLLHESLTQAARSAGFWVPRLLRATPVDDLDRAGVATMIAEKGFFCTDVETKVVAPPADLRLLPGNTLVEDRSTGRIWTRGCIQTTELPNASLPNAEEEVAEFTPAEQRSAEQESLVEARRYMRRRMRLAISDWIARLNFERLGGYDDWRLPTTEEAMSLMTKELHERDVHISPLFSDHSCIRTSDESAELSKLSGRLGIESTKSVWVVCYKGGNCLEVAEEAPVPLRFVRTDLDE